MKAALFAVSLLALSSPAFASITQSQASSDSYSSYIAKVKSVCNGKTLPLSDLLFTSPYDIKGKCYSLPLTAVTQLISRHSELIAGGLMMLVFSGNEGYPIVYPSVVVGLGAFRYTTVTGALRIIPMVRYVAKRVDNPSRIALQEKRAEQEKMREEVEQKKLEIRRKFEAEQKKLEIKKEADGGSGDWAPLQSGKATPAGSAPLNLGAL